jgi:hypothetical protein
MSKGLSENPNQSPVVWFAFALTPSNKLAAPFAVYFGLGVVTKLKAVGVIPFFINSSLVSALPIQPAAKALARMGVDVLSTIGSL